MIIKKIFYSTFIILLAHCLWASPVLATARLAVLVSSDSRPYLEVLAGLRANLTQAKTAVSYDYFHLDNKPALAQKAIEKIRKERPDVVITLGTLAYNSTVDEIKDIPIVAGMILSKEKIQRHQNATGVALEFPIDIQFAWLKKFFPSARNIGVLYNPEQNNEIIKKARSQARSIGLNLVALPVPIPKKLPSALKKMATKADVLWGLGDTVVLNKKTAKNILLFSFRNKIPFVGLSNAWVKAGAYYALDRNYQDIGGQCGEMVNKILAGAAVETIAPTFPRQITYSLNTKTAKKMRMQIDKRLIKNAAKVF